MTMPVRLMDDSGLPHNDTNPIHVEVISGGVDQSNLPVVSPTISTATACSGQITVATAGTAVQGPNTTNAGGFYIKAHPNNTDTVWIGNDGAGDITNLNSYPLNSGEQIIVSVTNLNVLWFDADVSGEKVCWHKA